MVRRLERRPVSIPRRPAEASNPVAGAGSFLAVLAGVLFFPLLDLDPVEKAGLVAVALVVVLARR